MARPVIDDEFNAFFTWARDNKRLSPGVAKQYASYLRRIARSIGGFVQDPNAVNDFFDRAFSSDPAYARLRSAWTSFSEYYYLVHGITLPQPPSSFVASARVTLQNTLADSQLTSLPGRVRSALRVFEKNGISMTTLNTLTWGLVVVEEMSQVVTHIQVPNKPGTTWVVPSDAVRELYEFAQPGSNGSVPLVPFTPGTLMRYPFLALQREAQTFGSPEEELASANDNGSAIGAMRRAHAQKNKPDQQEQVPLRSTKDVLDMLDKPSEIKLYTPRSTRRTEDVEDENSLSRVMSFDPNED